MSLSLMVNSEFQLNYDDSQFFENVLRNLNGRTKKEMSMLGQVCWLGLTNCKILMMFWFRVSTDPYGRQPPLWSMLTIQGTGIRSVRRILKLFSPSFSQLLSNYISPRVGCKVGGIYKCFCRSTLIYLFFFCWRKFLKFYIHHHLLYEEPECLSTPSLPPSTLPPRSRNIDGGYVCTNDIFILCSRPEFFNLHFTTRKTFKCFIVDISSVLSKNYPRRMLDFSLLKQRIIISEETHWRFLCNS